MHDNTLSQAGPSVDLDISVAELNLPLVAGTARKHGVAERSITYG